MLVTGKEVHRIHCAYLIQRTFKKYKNKQNALKAELFKEMNKVALNIQRYYLGYIQRKEYRKMYRTRRLNVTG